MRLDHGQVQLSLFARRKAPSTSSNWDCNNAEKRRFKASEKGVWRRAHVHVAIGRHCPCEEHATHKRTYTHVYITHTRGSTFIHISDFNVFRNSSKFDWWPRLLTVAKKRSSENGLQIVAFLGMSLTPHRFLPSAFFCDASLLAMQPWQRLWAALCCESRVFRARLQPSMYIIMYQPPDIWHGSEHACVQGSALWKKKSSLPSVLELSFNRILGTLCLS